jgi:hypothetical protein
MKGYTLYLQSKNFETSRWLIEIAKPLKDENIPTMDALTAQQYWP